MGTQLLCHYALQQEPRGPDVSWPTLRTPGTLWRLPRHLQDPQPWRMGSRSGGCIPAPLPPPHPALHHSQIWKPILTRDYGIPKAPWDCGEEFGSHHSAIQVAFFTNLQWCEPLTGLH